MAGREACDQYSSIESGYGTFSGPEKGSRSRYARRQKPHPRIRSQSWMSYLDDDTSLTTITIPGTHDSAAFTKAWPFIATQNMNIVEQLNAGIRYFDLRCGVRDDVVEMVHGPTYLGLKLEEALDSMYAWLAEHPSEALIVQIKRDRKEQRTKMDFSHAIWKVMAPKSERWRTANTIPCLGEMRGRIQLFRRFEGPSLVDWGMDVTRWQDNPTKPFTIYTSHDVQITIQDHYSFHGPVSLPSLIAKKCGNVIELLERASNDQDENHWYINFTSAYEINLWYQLPPRAIALGGWYGFRRIDGMNTRLEGYFREKGGSKRRLGIVATDFPELGAEGLIAALVRTNFDSKKKSYLENAVFWLSVLTLLAILSWAVALGSGRPFSVSPFLEGVWSTSVIE